MDHLVALLRAFDGRSASDERNARRLCDQCTTLMVKVKMMRGGKDASTVQPTIPKGPALFELGERLSALERQLEEWVSDRNVPTTSIFPVPTSESGSLPDELQSRIDELVLENATLMQEIEECANHRGKTSRVLSELLVDGGIQEEEIPDTIIEQVLQAKHLFAEASHKCQFADRAIRVFSEEGDTRDRLHIEESVLKELGRVRRLKMSPPKNRTDFGKAPSDGNAAELSKVNDEVLRMKQQRDEVSSILTNCVPGLGVPSEFTPDDVVEHAGLVEEEWHKLKRRMDILRDAVLSIKRMYQDVTGQDSADVHWGQSGEIAKSLELWVREMATIMAQKAMDHFQPTPATVQDYDDAAKACAAEVEDLKRQKADLLAQIAVLDTAHEEDQVLLGDLHADLDVARKELQKARGV